MRATGHLGCLSQSSCHVTNIKNGRNNFSVITEYGGNHLALFWPQEVSGLLITASLANSYKEAMLLPWYSPELLSKYWHFVSPFSQQWRTRWKTEVWIEDTLHLGDEECFFFERGKQIKREGEMGRGLNAGEETEIEGKRHRGTNRERGRKTDRRRSAVKERYMYPQSEFKCEAHVFSGFVFLYFPTRSCSMYVRQRN